jgi:hypothetical protein
MLADHGTSLSIQVFPAVRMLSFLKQAEEFLAGV